MMVTFVSQCEKKALKKTRRVLDAFADRVGDNTWQTVITEAGLNTVRKMLRQTASKSTAVSCHWIRSRSRSQLLWVVGNRSKFDERGVVPVNYTEKALPDFENNWRLLPLIKAMSALAALLHDWGKASTLFQEKLKSRSRKGDPLRHEWISCLLLYALVTSCSENNDQAWLQKLIDSNLDEVALYQGIKKAGSKKFSDLPPAAASTLWLILSHHRLPVPEDIKNWRGEVASGLEQIVKWIRSDWGYENRYEDESDFSNRLEKCFDISTGGLSKSTRWAKEVRKWSGRLFGSLSILEECCQEGTLREVLCYSRVCLMLADYSHSSQPADMNWPDETGLFANTDKKGALKQKLDEHLTGVEKKALRIAHFLPRFESMMPRAEGNSFLRKPSRGIYAWQEKGVEEIRLWKRPYHKAMFGFFAVNMASTGCGKTIANAKIMCALSEEGDALRYTLSLGLRTLTMQTGDEYRGRIGLDDSEMAVLIGSRAVMDLHKMSADDSEGSGSFWGSESREPLLEGEVDLDCPVPEELFATVLEGVRERKFLFAPVLVCTIDHMMSATECIRGGRHILPFLRLLSSDLVIDEVDDFSGSDLVAIGRLVHLAGMLGRKVMISSATIPPDLAEGYYNAYRAGWGLYARERKIKDIVGCAWIDEFTSEVHTVATLDDFRGHHAHFVTKRSEKLKKQPVRRKAEIVYCQELLEESDLLPERDKQETYFSHIQDALIDKHRQHHVVDGTTGKKVSFGVVRMANIPPCVSLARYLLKIDWPDDVAVRVMPYHSQQVLLLRHEQEKHLDRVLSRKNTPGTAPKVFEDVVIRRHLDSCAAPNLIFILVATPVEEVGRDHDFDWAIVEPSSCRSIIQLAGRVRRHRREAVDCANIALLQYNWKTIKEGDRPDRRYFCRPGFEEVITLQSHDLSRLVDVEQLAKRVDATPRICKPERLDAKGSLRDLEHYVVEKLLTNYAEQGPESLEGYLRGGWYLTGLPHKLAPFRKGEPSTKLFLLYDSENDRLVFAEKDREGNPVEVEGLLRIRHVEINEDEKKRLWLARNYRRIVEGYAEKMDKSTRSISLRYGELSFIWREQGEYEYSDHFGLVKIEEGRCNCV